MRKQRRSFIQYIKDNWMVLIPFTMAIAFATYAWYDAGPVLGGMFAFFGVTYLVASLIHWRRNG